MPAEPRPPFPRQHQRAPGSEARLRPQPRFEARRYRAAAYAREGVAEFGGDHPMGRPAQPEELAPAYVFLASDADSPYITGSVLEVMGGRTTGG